MRPRRARRPTPLLPILFVVIIAIIFVIVLAWRPKNSTNTNSLSSQNVNTGTNTNVAEEESTNTNTAPLEQTTEYRNTEFGFSLEYPSSWKTDTNENGEGENRIVNFIFGSNETGVTLIALPASMEGVVRESVSIVSEKKATINGIAATTIAARSSKDGSPVSLIFFSKGATLFDLNGPADLVERVGSTFHFIE